MSMPEAVEMILAILAGGGAGPGTGWFHPSQTRYGWPWLAERMDSDKDNAITVSEFQGPPDLFQRLDRDGDGKLTPADFDWTPPRQTTMEAPPPGFVPPSRWTLLKGLFKGEIGSMRHGPALGQLAPPFRLTTQDGKRSISPEDYRGKKPVVLIFGSFT
jgi:hypothetical protein